MYEEAPYHVVYLTGPPASGKSTLANALGRSVRPLQIISYSALLKDYMNTHYEPSITVDNLRQESAHRVRPEDVEAVDQTLVEQVNRHRHSKHILVDSHPVTKEDYGFRVTAFSIPLLQALAPTMICVLYADSSVIKARTEVNDEGRKSESAFEADVHRSLQATVALVYGITLGVPIYFLDSDRSAQDVVAEIARRLQSRNPQTVYEPTLL